MKEIKAGEYVRTQDGKIDKVIEISGEYILLKNNFKITEFRESRIYFKIKDITKHSPNIIDLIEVDDYVNGEIVIDIGERGLYLGYADDNEYYSRISIDESEIKSVVTHEQFNQVKYEV